MISITIVDPKGQRHQLSFEETGVTVGRALDNDLVLPASEVSNQHCKIFLTDGKVVVSDLSSSNGTFVNGLRLFKPTVLRLVDQLLIGPYLLTVERVDPPPQPAQLELDALPTPSHLRPSRQHSQAKRGDPTLPASKKRTTANYGALPRKPFGVPRDRGATRMLRSVEVETQGEEGEKDT